MVAGGWWCHPSIHPSIHRCSSLLNLPNLLKLLHLVDGAILEHDVVILLHERQDARGLEGGGGGEREGVVG